MLWFFFFFFFVADKIDKKFLWVNADALGEEQNSSEGEKAFLCGNRQ